MLKIRINKLILFYKQFKNNTALASSNMIKVLFEVMKWIKYSYIRNVKLSTNQSINQSINRSINFKLNQVSKLKYEDYRLWISKLLVNYQVLLQKCRWLHKTWLNSYLNAYFLSLFPMHSKSRDCTDTDMNMGYPVMCVELKVRGPFCALCQVPDNSSGSVQDPRGRKEIFWLYNSILMLLPSFKLWNCVISVKISDLWSQVIWQ